jgi:glycosyltransferase involved in cell wall biosynthesis
VVREHVTVVITTFNHARFLAEALASVAAQTHPASEVIVVDDGSTDDPAGVVAGRPGVRLIHQENRGLAAARNTGVRASRCPYVLFLDADDLLTPIAIAAGLDCFDRHPEAALVYGAHRRVDGRCHSLGGRRYDAITGDPFAALLRGNIIGMHAAVLYRRDVLLAAGGFDESLPRCEDYDVYLRIARTRPVASHPAETALYRWHGQNMSSSARSMLGTLLRVHRAHRPGRADGIERRRSWRTGRSVWRHYYAAEVLSGRPPGGSRWSAVLAAARLSPFGAVRVVARKALRKSARILPGPVSHRFPGGRPRPLGTVRLGHLDRVQPVSADFGWDRGLPIDRFYIESFLARRAADIRGSVLEVGDAGYSRRFGGDRVTAQDVLHVHSGNPAATIVGDLSTAGVLPRSAFDCIVLTQTLHLVFDLGAAVEHLHAALRPGGVLLLTVPGISQMDRGEWRDSWFWSLAPAAVTRLLGDRFGAEAVHVESHGNAFAATAFLQGLAVQEVDARKLDVQDPAYPVLVAARAQKW